MVKGVDCLTRWCTTKHSQLLWVLTEKWKKGWQKKTLYRVVMMPMSYEEKSRRQQKKTCDKKYLNFYNLDGVVDDCCHCLHNNSINIFFYQVFFVIILQNLSYYYHNNNNIYFLGNHLIVIMTNSIRVFRDLCENTRNITKERCTLSFSLFIFINYVKRGC